MAEEAGGIKPEVKIISLVVKDQHDTEVSVLYYLVALQRHVTAHSCCCQALFTLSLRDIRPLACAGTVHDLHDNMVGKHCFVFCRSCSRLVFRHLSVRPAVDIQLCCVAAAHRLGWLFA